MHYLDITLASSAENLALDEVLLLEAEAGQRGELLRVWELAQYAVVLGVSGQLREEVDEAACAADGVPILRRASGGGTVLLGPGCLQFSLVLSLARTEVRDVTRSYRFIADTITGAFADVGLKGAGSSDFAIENRKVSGNAQRRLRKYLLHHGTLLYDFDTARIGRYLRPPPRQPAYRAGRPHEAFVTNLPLAADEIKQRLRIAWAAKPAGHLAIPSQVKELVRAKYGVREWIARR